MMKRRKVFYWIGGILSGILLLLCLLLLVAPLLISLDSVHGEIEARFDRETGGQGTFRKVDIYFLPRPHAVIRGGKLSFPGRDTLVFETLTVYPQILPLLKGAFLPARIELSSPRTDIDLESAKKDQSSILFSDIVGKGEIPPGIRTWINKTDDLKIRIENGLLNLIARDPIFKNRASFQFSNINISAEQSNDNLTVKSTCTSNFFEHMNLEGQLELASFIIKGDLTLSGFKTGESPYNPQDHEVMGLEDGLVDLQMSFEGMGLESLKTHVNLSAPALMLSRDQRRIRVEGVQVQGNIQFEKGVLVASLSRLTLDYPRMDLSGTRLKLGKKENDGPRVSIQLEGKDVDVPAVRSCALALADDITPVKDIFAVITDGHVPSIWVDAQGKTLADLGNLNNYTIKGQMRRGKISLKNPRLNLTDVEGNALISNGILRGQRLLATLGKVNGKEGILTVALKDNVAPFYLNIQVNADLAEAHSVLKRIVTKGVFREGLNHVRSIEGHANAGLTLDESESGLLVDVDCSSCRLKAVYQSLPFPVIVSKGKIHYRQNHLRFRDLEGSYGRTGIFEASGLFDWQADTQMDIASAKATICLEEVYSQFATMKEQPEWFKKLDGIKGQTSHHTLRVKGPLEKPTTWQYETDFDMRNVSLEASFMPGRLAISQAQVSANTKRARFNNAVIHILDAELNMSGKLGGPLTDLKMFETTLSGTLGFQGMQYLYETFEMPEDFLLRTPMTIHSGRALWQKNTGVSFDGNLLFPEGAAVSLDVSYGPAKLNIRKLVVDDDTTRATLALLAHEALVDIDFSGKLQKSTLDGLFAKNLILDGWIEGDISARILPQQSFSTSAEGFLKGKGIPIYGVALPATIEDFSLRAEGQLLRVDSARMAIYENRLVISGNADLSTENTRFDVDISTDNVDLDKILAFLKESDTDAASNDKDPWSFPIRGTAHLMWDSLKIGGYTWHPFQGEITVDPDGIRVAVENSRLCGIDSPGVLRFNQDGIELAFGLKAEKGNLNQTMTCLTKKRVIAEGTFDLDGKIEGKGNWNNLFLRLEGPFLFSSADGQVRQDPALAGVISVLSVTDIFQGKLPAFEKEGFPYDLVWIKANLKDGKIHIHKGIMNSTAMDLVFQGDMDLLNDRMDLNMLASPFTLTDRIIRLIPVAGYILGGTLISVPVKVDGPMKNPKVRILPLSEIGSGVWGIMKRTLETPVKLVEPLVGEGKKPKDNENESIFR
ncbi:MAG: AsmA-like C-terminal region-containing protein [Deltaproteobacteria bacterium]|nr:AsmA-like C-terminal region-containing protein [Deltaproteobacteria bacterium]